MVDPCLREHDPGGKVRLRLIPNMAGKAEFSPCEQYRYWLSRDWDAGGSLRSLYQEAREGYALWIGMNPSTAEAEVDDPTIRKEIRFTEDQLGLRRYVKVNVMDYRATNPKKLLEPGVLPRSPANREVISRFAQEASLIVAAWGALPVKLHAYAADTLDDLAYIGALPRLMCMGTTKDGSPKHPLYLPLSTRLTCYSPPL